MSASAAEARTSRPLHALSTYYVSLAEGHRSRLPWWPPKSVRDAGQTFVLGRSPRASRGAAALESHSRSTNGSRHAGASKGAPK
jgi:hypothetical protein